MRLNLSASLCTVFLLLSVLPGFVRAQEINHNLPVYYEQMKASVHDTATQSAENPIVRHARPWPKDTVPDIQVHATEQRDGYVAMRISYQVSAWARVYAYLLLPDHEPGTLLPAVLLLHDHGAHFEIGKEKVVRPITDDTLLMSDAYAWAARCYDGRFIGDELAGRGYVVLVSDALMWGERQAVGGTRYELQQALACNLMQMGYSLAGLMLHDDMRAAGVLSALDVVDTKRISAVGYSMGAYRAWLLAASCPVVTSCAAVCWMSTNDQLIRVDNNQTKGGSAWSMFIPGLLSVLDYPEQAALACPKPMLIINATDDRLFPLEGVRSAYARMHQLWQAATGEKTVIKSGRQKVRPDASLWMQTGTLCTHLVEGRHVFDKDMQQEVFDWLMQQ